MRIFRERLGTGDAPNTDPQAEDEAEAAIADTEELRKLQAKFGEFVRMHMDSKGNVLSYPPVVAFVGSSLTKWAALGVEGTGVGELERPQAILAKVVEVIPASLDALPETYQKRLRTRQTRSKLFIEMLALLLGVEYKDTLAKVGPAIENLMTEKHNFATHADKDALIRLGNQIDDLLENANLDRPDPKEAGAEGEAALLQKEGGVDGEPPAKKAKKEKRSKDEGEEELDGEGDPDEGDIEGDDDDDDDEDDEDPDEEEDPELATELERYLSEMGWGKVATESASKTIRPTLGFKLDHEEFMVKDRKRKREIRSKTKTFLKTTAKKEKKVKEDKALSSEEKATQLKEFDVQKKEKLLLQKERLLDEVADKTDLFEDGKGEAARLAGVDYAVKLCYKAFTTKSPPLMKNKFHQVVATRAIEETEEVVLPMFGMACQKSQSKFCMKFVDDFDVCDYYFVPARAALSSSMDLAWSLLPKVDGPHFELVFKFVMVGSTTYGDYTPLYSHPKKRMHAVELDPATASPGHMVRVPFLRKLSHVTLAKDEVAYRAQNALMDH